jgi:hypothetical protein
MCKFKEGLRKEMEIDMRKYNTDIKIINRFLCYIPSLSLVGWLGLTFYATLIFGRLPTYGLDPDPSSTSIYWLDIIATIAAIISFFTIPTTLFLTIDLIINRQKLLISDKIGILVSATFILTFFISKYYLTDTFLWVMD